MSDFSQEEAVEMLEQQITLTLQQIDTNFQHGFESSTRLLAKVKTFQTHTADVHANLQIWNQFFNSFHTVGVSDELQQRLYQAQQTQQAQDLSLLASTQVQATTTTAATTTPATHNGPTSNTSNTIDDGNNNTKQNQEEDNDDKDLSSPALSTPTLGSEPRTTPFTRVPGFHSGVKAGAASPFTPGTNVQRHMRFSIGTMRAVEDDDDDDDDEEDDAGNDHGHDDHVEDQENAPVSGNTPSSSANNVVAKDNNSQAAAKKFDLSVFPTVFQEGVGALQLTEVYSQFVGDKVMSIGDVQGLVDGTLDDDRVLLLLDALETRGYLRQLFANGEIYWQRCNE